MVDKALEELGYDYLLVPLNRDGVVQLGFRCVHAGKLGRDFFYLHNVCAYDRQMAPPYNRCKDNKG